MIHVYRHLWYVPCNMGCFWKLSFTLFLVFQGGNWIQPRKSPNKKFKWASSRVLNVHCLNSDMHIHSMYILRPTTVSLIDSIQNGLLQCGSTLIFDTLKPENWLKHFTLCARLIVLSFNCKLHTPWSHTWPIPMTVYNNMELCNFHNHRCIAEVNNLNIRSGFYASWGRYSDGVN